MLLSFALSLVLFSRRWCGGTGAVYSRFGLTSADTALSFADLVHPCIDQRRRFRMRVALWEA